MTNEMHRTEKQEEMKQWEAYCSSQEQQGEKRQNVGHHESICYCHRLKGIFRIKPQRFTKMQNLQVPWQKPLYALTTIGVDFVKRRKSYEKFDIQWTSVFGSSAAEEWYHDKTPNGVNA